MKTGFSIRTWKKRISVPNPELLDMTTEYYRKVANFYYHLLRRHEELFSLGITGIQRELEILSIPGRDGREPSDPLPYEKVPLYIRRSAINKAAIAVKAALAKSEEHPIYPDEIEPQVTFYKGAYRDLSNESIDLKLWDGESWEWVSCELSGRELPENGTCLSPSLVHDRKFAYLHIPVKTETSDGRTLKERLQQDGRSPRICSVRFTNTDIFAMCAVLDEKGELAATHACHGGRTYVHRCRHYEERIRLAETYIDQAKGLQANRKYYQHLQNLSDHYAHQVSREIVDFCKEENARIIAIPKYREDRLRMIMSRCGTNSPMALSSQIRKRLMYKAWAEGIVVLEPLVEGISSRCAVCGGKVTQKTRTEFTCENGHQGNRFLNEARVLGRKCQQSLSELV
ncbi:MAG: transposase [Blautia sp.]|nr:transposase [Blautia sp.]